MLSFNNDEKNKKDYLEYLKSREVAELVPTERHWVDNRGNRQTKMIMRPRLLRNTDYQIKHDQRDSLGFPDWFVDCYNSFIRDFYRGDSAKTYALSLFDTIPVGYDLDNLKIPFIKKMVQGCLTEVESGVLTKKAKEVILEVGKEVLEELTIRYELFLPISRSPFLDSNIQKYLLEFPFPGYPSLESKRKRSDAAIHYSMTMFAESLKQSPDVWDILQQLTSVVDMCADDIDDLAPSALGHDLQFSCVKEAR